MQQPPSPAAHQVVPQSFVAENPNVSLAGATSTKKAKVKKGKKPEQPDFGTTADPPKLPDANSVLFYNWKHM